MTRKPRLLIVDDDRLMLSFISKIAEAGGLDVKGTADPKSVLKLAESWDPDGMIIDIVMPEMDGIEVVRGLIGLDRPVPILLVSAYDERYLKIAKQLAEVVHAASINTLQKPLEIAGLQAFFAEMRAAMSSDEGAPAMEDPARPRAPDRG